MNYKEIAYLIGCHAIVADNEINALELNILDNYLHIEKNDELYSKRQNVFSDSEDKVELITLIKELKLLQLSNEQKEEILKFLAKIVYSDGHLANPETILIEKIAKVINIDYLPILEKESLNNDTNIASNRLKWHESLWGRFESFAYNVSSKDDKNTDRLIGGLGFARVLEKITDEAIVDLERVSCILDDINTDLINKQSDLGKSIPVKRSNDKDINKVTDIVLSIREHFEEIINNSINRNKELLDKKKRNMRYFTIAFMGRTKAGKSTLHKVVTQQENDDIGIGKLRTTRYNRSWYWDRLRIVDTPGIGAPGGEADTEIAKSIIDEADMICYVVTSDAIQETEFDFFETIKERNKPLYIILNYKSNLSEDAKLEKFLKNPTDWKDCTGRKSIQGHFERIKERLEGKYNMDAVEIIPLHLLAAVLYMEKEQDDESKAALLKGSNIETFIRAIKREIYETGCLKKSLSVIDGTSYQINDIHKKLDKDYQNLLNAVTILKDKKSRLNKFIKEESKRLEKDLKDIFDAADKELKNRASSFANEHYDNEKADVKWKNDSVVKGIFGRLQSRVISRIEDFSEKLKSKLEEVSSDIRVSFTFISADDVNGESIINTKFGAGVFGAIFTAAAPFIIGNIWHPGGWIMTGITLAVWAVATLFTSLFTSKNEKIRKATEKMKTQLNENIDKCISENQAIALNNVRKSVNTVSSHINGIFGTYIEGTENILQNINTLKNNCKDNEKSINSLIGFRILEYVNRAIVRDAKIKDMTNQFLRENYPVERDWKKHSLIFKYPNKCSYEEKMKAEKATQMTINF